MYQISSTSPYKLLIIFALFRIFDFCTEIVSIKLAKQRLHSTYLIGIQSIHMTILLSIGT